LVGQLGPENYQFYLDRGLDMLWVGLKLDSNNHDANVEVIKNGVAKFEGK
jgi:hypothetical protein